VTFKQIRTAALELPEPSRADLAQTLLQSLVEVSDKEDEHDQVWAEEAARRYQDLQENPASGVSAEDAFRKLRAAVR